MGTKQRMKSVFLFLALIAITQSSELQELSNTDVEPVVNLDADKTEVAAAPEHDDIGEGQFGGGGFGGALLTTGSFTMMAASGFRGVSVSRSMLVSGKKPSQLFPG